MQKITPFLWFDGKVEEAARFYTSVFKNSKITSLSGPPGNVMSATFILDGEEFMALNGGPMFTFSPAISLFVDCKSQEEVDYFWEKLSEGGEKQRCGWLKDQFGISWQIVPDTLGQLMGGGDPVKSQKVMQAMLKIDKLDIQGLKDAAES
ncbi:VOC family protein [Emticicia sp. CRIBPO]|uniref:VOC family protein n=1 Tax=Emticicia sp. CRIBPO TaxID=2683258 RepID=UPI001412E10B|nr:VOC family protein [Emticicia sp. CRIBPO]NBA87558.1 VOC family protein [Emticicia sp. CRIBPO]